MDQGLAGVGGVVWLVLHPIVMKRSLRALAMSVGSVHFVSAYMMVVGDVRVETWTK
jgi:hypothetical protein